MVAPESPRVNATAEGTPIARTETDPRVVAFLRFCKAIDCRDVSLMKKATRELRTLGISVCVVAPRREGGQG